MKLLTKKECNDIENLLKNHNLDKTASDEYIKAIKEIKDFFNNHDYKYFLEVFYFYRNNYINRYPSNRLLFKYLRQKLYLEESTLYAMRRQIIYKSAMVFYKYNIL